MRLAREQVIAFRLAAEGLVEPAESVAAVAAGWALQDSPPGTAALAVAARVPDAEPGAVERALAERRLLAAYNPRTATAVLPAGDLAVWRAALRPHDEAAWRHVLGGALADAEMPAERAAALAADAVRAALDGRVLSRDELHEELRGRLPRELLPWCPGCESNHARRGLLVAAVLDGALCTAGRAGRQPAFARADQWLAGAGGSAAGPDAAGAELVRRYLARYAPSNEDLLAGWAGIARHQARRLWRLVADELVEVEADDGTSGRPQRRYALAADADRLASPPRAEGVHLLPPADPLLLARDRSLLFPDRDVQRRVWRPIGSPGVVVAAGALAALWRGRKQGRRLAVAVEPLAPLDAQTRAAIEQAAERAAAHRGCAAAAVAYAG